MTARPLPPLLLRGDCIARMRDLPDASIDAIVTSPPYYGLRDYGHGGQIGAEQTVDEYVARLVAVFAEVRRVLKQTGTLWLNLGDSYANDSKWGGSTGGKAAKSLHGSTGAGRAKRSTGLPAKSLIGIPWRVALALQADGWVLRSDVIWSKPNAMPESVTDRPTKAHEYVFMLTKSPRYHYDAAAVAEPVAAATVARMRTAPPRMGGSKHGASTATETRTKSGKPYAGGETRRRRTVWSIPTAASGGAHFAVMPFELARVCILASTPPGGVVLDPFAGSGTTLEAAHLAGFESIGVELTPDYWPLIEARIERAVATRAKAKP